MDMKPESVELSFKEGSSDKVYQAELVESGDGWLVNFAYGRRGAALATGSKTAAPIPYEDAVQVYGKLVKSKIGKGYKAKSNTVDINTVEKEDVGIRPQLLNEIEEKDAHRYIHDDRWCMQEKNDGRRKMIQKTGQGVQAANKKGFVTALTTAMVMDVNNILGPCVLDGEDMGDYILLFDELSFPNMGYDTRYQMLKDLVTPRSKVLRVVETAWTAVEKQVMFDKLKLNNAEGAVFKVKNAVYTQGRPNSGGDQLKCKFYESASCIVTSQNKVKSSIAVHVLDVDGAIIPVGNVTIYPNVVTPAVGDIVEVKYLYYYPGGSLYQPVLLGVRDDVDPDECKLDKLKTKREN